MNSVLLHDSDKANQLLAGRYAMGLTDVYQTLHDRLLEALQRWIPPSEKAEDSVPTTTAASTSPQPRFLTDGGHGNLVELPMFLYRLSGDPIDPALGGLQLDLNNIHLLLAKSSSVNHLTTNATVSPTTIAAMPTTSTPCASESLAGKNNPNSLTASPTKSVSQSRFYPPLTVCTAGLQYTSMEKPSTAAAIDNAPGGLRQTTPHKKNGFIAQNAVSVDQTVQNQHTSFNLLHQLLSGADMSQVRTRSELIEPSLCTKSVSGSSDVQSKPVAVQINTTHPCLIARHPPHSTPNESRASEWQEETGSTESDWSLTSMQSNTHRTSSFQPTIPKSAFHSTHSPMDTTPATMVPTSTVSNPSMVQHPSATFSLLDENLQSANSALLTEKLLHLLIELQKTQMASTLAVTPRPNTSPCSSVPDGQRTPISLSSSPAPVFAKSMTTPTSTKGTNEQHNIHIPATNSNCDHLRISSRPSVHRQLPSSKQSLSCASELPLRTALYEQQRVMQLPSDQNYEPRPRSKSDVHTTTRRHIRPSRDHRSRSQTKTDRIGGGHMEQGAAECESGAGACELESSLFAQLILSPDSPTCTTPRSTGTDNMTVGSNSSGGAPSRNYTPTRDLIPSPSRPTALIEDSTPPQLICHTGSRNQVFEWLRESDLFVAEHCFDIPLGALLATAISPGRSNLAEICCSALFTSNPPTDPVPGLAKHVVNKLWHQLLLVALIENNFVPVCLTNESPQRLVATVCGQSWIDAHAQPLRDKVLNAISSLAALDIEESPAPDQHLVAELKQLVTSGAQLKLTPELFRLIRFCILAQNAYPHHFSTTYSEAISELEAELAATPDAPALVDVLKLLNHLHCFDAGTLKQFFGLSCDPANDPTSAASVATQVRINTKLPSPSESWTGGSGSVKRKAHGSCGLLTRNRSIDRDPSPIQFRSRAYTTTGCNKSARLCDTSITTTSSMSANPNNTNADTLIQPPISGATRILDRLQSDSVPAEHSHFHHHHRRTERPWKIGIR